MKAPIDFLGAGGKDGEDWNDPNHWGWEDPENPSHFGVLGRNPEPGDWSIRCPYGRPGDRLWVRETWGLWDTEPGDGHPGADRIFYRATDGDRRELRHQLWRPSIHMPRWASRITLEIAGVRVERLQDISEEDAIAEGVDSVSMADVPRQACWTRRQDFRQLWDQINGKRAGCSWEANPWVWAIEFRSVES